MRKVLNSQRIFLIHQHGRRFVVLDDDDATTRRHVKTLYTKSLGPLYHKILRPTLMTISFSRSRKS